MTSNKFQQLCTQILSELGLANSGEVNEISSLAGGVSSDIAVVTVGDKKFCVKCSLEQLRVAEVWEAPLRRNQTEYEWLSFVGKLLPNAVPALYGKSSSGNGFVMAFCDPTTHKNWKSELMQGRVDCQFAAQVGDLLGQIHLQSTKADIDFPYQDDFKKLRLEPYFQFTAAKHPELKNLVEEVCDQLYQSRIALVHGDVSPKNILMAKSGPIFLDAECAVMSDPAFDLSFCINHLVLKMIIGVAEHRLLEQSIMDLWNSYQQQILWEKSSQLEARICRLLPLMMLARVDGKSPIEYHTESSKDHIRNISLNLISKPEASLLRVLQRINAE